MMFDRWFNSGRPIGCDIAGGHVRLAQVQAQGARGIVVAARPLASELREDDAGSRERLSATLRQMLRSAPFRGKRVVGCVPHRHVKYRPMRLAPIPDDELASAAHWKAASELGVKSDRLKSAVIRCGDVIDGGKTRREVLTVVANVETVERQAAVFVEAGLTPVALDLSACAVARCLSPAPAAASAEVDAPVAHLEFDHASATLSVARAGRIRLIRGVGPGLGRADELAASLLEASVSDAQALRRVLACEAGDDPSPTVWPLPACPPERARLAIADAWRMYGRELAREVSLSLRHFTETFSEPLSETAVILSETPVGREVIDVLLDQSGVAFAPAAGLPRSDWEAAVKDAGGGEPAQWLTAIGLSLYDDRPPAAGTGKEAA